jgi:glycosyltransferase involved in cell wall biosynthesis
MLIANYEPDGQQSMRRFSAVLERELRQRGCEVSVLAPRAIAGALRAGRTGVGKWLGYVDKFLLFPWTLRSAIRRARRNGADVVVHIADHSNATYTRYLRDVPHLVTCNDLLAVRSARGEFPQNPTRWSGRILQRMILSGLNQAQEIACISGATRQDVLRLCALRPSAVRLVYMGLNYPYAPRPGAALTMRDRPFVLHVGGNQWYKNRLGVLRIYAELKKASRGAAVPALLMVGERFTKPMRDFIAANGLSDDVIERAGVGNQDLEALYTGAELLLYPSLAEGFGWPVLEAMACGCRVVTSGRAPLTEVGGTAAVYIDPEDVAAAAHTTLAVLHESPDDRMARVEAGIHHQRQFSTATMIDSYLDVYRSLSGRRGRERSAPLAAV